jgi:hypothetical protein
VETQQNLATSIRDNPDTHSGQHLHRFVSSISSSRTSFTPCDERTELHSAADLGIWAQPFEIGDVAVSGQPRLLARRFGRS